jgi:hypothetical protein
MLKQHSVGIPTAPLGHIILILSQLVFALTPKCDCTGRCTSNYHAITTMTAPRCNGNMITCFVINIHNTYINSIQQWYISSVVLILLWYPLHLLYHNRTIITYLSKNTPCNLTSWVFPRKEKSLINKYVNPFSNKKTWETYFHYPMSIPCVYTLCLYPMSIPCVYTLCLYPMSIPCVYRV